jgi:hypothetical protein
MAFHNQVAKSARLHKEASPEKYCRVPVCLWMTAKRVNGEIVLNANPCRNHIEYNRLAAETDEILAEIKAEEANV